MGRKHKHFGGIIGASPLDSNGALRPGVSNLGALSADNAFEAPSLDLNFDGQASSYTRATTSPTAAKANGDQLATDIVTQNKGGTVQSMYMGPDGKLITGYRENLLTYSEDFSSWTTVDADLTANQSDPFGGTAATIVADNDGNAFKSVMIATSTPGNTNGGNWTASMFVKKETSSVPNGLFRIWFGINEYYDGLFNAYHGTSEMRPRTTSSNATTSEQIIDAGGGWYRFVFTFQGVADTANAEFHFYPALQADTHPTYGQPPLDASQQGALTCFGAQLENSAILGDYIATNGAAAGFHVPRVEYDSSGNALGLLVEESRTNLIPFSDFTNAAWTAGNAYTVNTSSDSPSGSGSAEIVVAPSGDAWLYDDVSASGLVGQTMTYSLFAKSTNSTLTLKLQMIGAASTPPAAQLQVNPSTGGSLISTSTNITLSDYGAIAVGNGWHRYWMSFVVPNNTQDLRPNIVAAQGTTYAYGPQLEEGEGPTSYIPTYGAAATRTADDITLATSSFGYNTAAGTTLADFTMQEANDAFPIVYRFSDGTSSNRELVYLDGPSGDLYAASSQGGTHSYWSIESSPSFPINRTIAFRHDGTSAQTATDGTLGTAQTLSAAPATLRSTLQLGLQTGNHMTGHIRRFTYWPRAINDASLIAYTGTNPPTIDLDRPMRRWGGMTGRSLVAVPAFPAGSDFKISNGTVTGATYNGSGPTGSGYSSHWDTSSGSNYFSWTPSNASAPTAFTVIVDFETTDTTGAYKQIASFDVSHPNERASFHAYQTDIGWYDGSVKTFGLTYAANTRYVAIAVFNGSVITAYLVDTAAGTIVTLADITAAKGTSTVTPGYTTAWNTPSAIGRHNFYAAEYLSGQVYGGAYWPSALTEAQLVDAINHIRGQIALPTTGVLSLAEDYQSKL